MPSLTSRTRATRRLATCFTGLLALFVGVGCETLVDADPTRYEPVLAISGVFTPGQLWVVHVRRSVGLGDTTSGARTQVTDATVEVLPEGGSPVTLRHVEYGRYVADSSAAGPEAGRAYCLRVSAPGYPQVSAASRVPQPVADARVIRGWDAPKGITPLTLRFADSAEAADFYELRVITGFDTPDAPEGPYSIPFRSDNPSLRQESFLTLLGGGDGVPTYGRGLISDALFDGGTFEAVLRVDGEFADGTYAVDLGVASEAYYLHERSLEEIEEAEGNPFAEPVPAYSNVEGGLGLFAGYLVQRLMASPAAW